MNLFNLKKNKVQIPIIAYFSRIISLLKRVLMTRNIVVEEAKYIPASKREVELVERKD